MSQFLLIGAGIIGLTSAVRLLKEGFSVTVLEKGEVGQESSWAGGGILSPLAPWDYSEPVTQLVGYSTSIYSKWVNELSLSTEIDPEFNECGMLVLPPYDSVKAHQWCISHNIKKEINHKSFWSTIHQSALEEAIFLPHVAQIRNPRLLAALQCEVIKRGGVIKEFCEVSRLNLKNKSVVSISTTSGNYSADGYIITAGAWSRKILGKYALNLNIIPIQGQMLLYKFDAPPIPSILLQKELYLIPRLDGHLLIGSTMENVGFNKQITQAAYDKLYKKASRLLPEIETKHLIKHWAGLRPASPSNIPTIGRHPDLHNLFINSGHFRYGVTMAPGSAEILLNEIMGKPQPFDISFYQKGWNQLGKIEFS